VPSRTTRTGSSRINGHRFDDTAMPVVRAVYLHLDVMSTSLGTSAYVGLEGRDGAGRRADLCSIELGELPAHLIDDAPLLFPRGVQYGGKKILHHLLTF
jgi:hypothetical protein